MCGTAQSGAWPGLTVWLRAWGLWANRPHPRPFCLTGIHMLYTLAVVLIVLWLLGLVTATTMGGFIHVLLVIAIVVVLLRVISGRRPL